MITRSLVVALIALLTIGAISLFAQVKPSEGPQQQGEEMTRSQQELQQQRAAEQEKAQDAQRRAEEREWQKKTPLLIFVGFVLFALLVAVLGRSSRGCGT